VKRWTYPLLVGAVLGSLVAGLSFRLVARDPLTANAGATYGTTTHAAPSEAGDGSETTTTAAGATGGPAASAIGGAATAASGAAASSSAAPSAALTASDVGVTATTIKIGVALLDLGGASAVGAAVPGFDPAVQQKEWETYIGELNRSGGILGRKVAAVYTKVNPLDNSAARAACIFFTQQEHVFAVFAGAAMANGDGDLCVAAENHTIDISASVLPTEFYARARGLLITSSAHGNRFFSHWARGSDRSGKLRGHKLGLLVDQGNPENMAKQGLIPALRGMGYQITYTATVSSDPSQGPSQVAPQVQQMRAAGVDTVLFATSFINATAFVNQADKQLWKPQYFVSDFEGLDVGTLLNGMPDSFRGAIAVSYYGFAPGPAHPESATGKSCRDRWNALTGSNLQPTGQDYANIAAVCVNVALLAQASRVAGANLTRASFSGAVQSLRSFDWGGLGGSFAPGKTDYGDAVRLMVWDKPNGTTSNCTSNNAYCWNDDGPAFNGDQG